MGEKVRHKKVNGKRRPLCDYHGNCVNLAYTEVYPSMLGGKYKDAGWSYLRKRHFKQEQKRLNKQLLYWALPKKANLKFS